MMFYNTQNFLVQKPRRLNEKETHACNNTECNPDEKPERSTPKRRSAHYKSSEHLSLK